MAKILLVEDHGIVRDALRAVLVQHGHQVLSASDGSHGLQVFRDERPDLVILDRKLPDQSGSQVLQAMRSQDPRARVLILTGFADEGGESKYRELGACAFVSKGLGLEALLRVVERELAPPDAPPPPSGPPRRDPPRLLVVDDEPSVRAILKRFLDGKGYRVETAADGLEALQRVQDLAPHLLLLDFNMPGLNGLETLRRLRGSGSRVAVIMLTSNDDVEAARECMRLGASDYILKPFDFDYLEKSVWAKILSLAP